MKPTHRVLALLTLVAAACAPASMGPAGQRPQPVPERRPVGARGAAGFDTRVYPGDETMRLWYENSPYEWVGYYLPAPCYTGQSWIGKQDTLRAMGWGLALIFLGEQDWSATRPVAAAASAPEPAPGAAPRCTAANLTAAKGETDGAVADSAAAAEGFPAGAVVFLDVERVDSVSAPLADYVRGWIRGLLAAGRYAPGLYAHGDNARALRDIQRQALSGRAHARDAAFWVASTEDFFSVESAPRDSGFDFATVWQGTFDRSETWGGKTLSVDSNVAESPGPSVAGKKQH